VSKPPDETELIARNKRARHDYEILEYFEAGIVLLGTEVKSLRGGKVSMVDAYGVVKDGEIWLLNLHISPYEKGTAWNHEPTRTRKLLLKTSEIRRLIGSVERKGLTLIPLEMHFRRGRAKVTIAVGRGKKLHDKRQDLKEKDAQRDVQRALRSNR
jgi:SsrA-binding protein